MYGMSNTPWCVGPSGPVSPARSSVNDDGQVLERHLLEDLVEAPLQERAVDVHDRPQPGLGLPGGEGDRVDLADAHVEEPVGEVARGPSPACSPGTWRRSAP